MSRSYKKPFHKLAPDREWQKKAVHKKEEGDCWGWPSEGAKIRVPGYKGIGK